MKTLSALVAMLFISLIFSEIALGGKSLKKSSQKFSKNSIESIKMGLNSGNKGLTIGCAILAGEYKITETVEHLAKILNSELPYDIKTAAVYALYQIQNKEALIALKKACIKNNCPFLKQLAEVFLNHYLICNPKEEIRVDESYLVVE